MNANTTEINNAVQITTWAEMMAKYIIAISMMTLAGNVLFQLCVVFSKGNSLKCVASLWSSSPSVINSSSQNSVGTLWIYSFNAAIRSLHLKEMTTLIFIESS